MYALLKRGEPTTTNSGMYDIFDKVRNTHDEVQRNSKEPHRFRVSIHADH